jgi:HSP20 family protein
MTGLDELFQPTLGFDEYLEKRMTEFFGTTPAPPARGITHKPLGIKLDVSETDKEYSVVGELPGVEKQDIQVHLEDHLLTIEAERKEEKEETTRSYHLKERSFGNISRSIRFPADVDIAEPSAQFENGVLRITIEKKEKNETRRKIEIQ